jgi:hypothetical protein
MTFVTVFSRVPKPITGMIGVLYPAVQQVLSDEGEQSLPLSLVNDSVVVVVDTDEPDRRLELPHDNVKKYGTVFNPWRPVPICRVPWFARSEAVAREGSTCSRFRITIQ